MKATHASVASPPAARKENSPHLPAATACASRSRFLIVAATTGLCAGPSDRLIILTRGAGGRTGATLTRSQTSTLLVSISWSRDRAYAHTPFSSRSPDRSSVVGPKRHQRRRTLCSRQVQAYGGKATCVAIAPFHQYVEL